MSLRLLALTLFTIPVFAANSTDCRVPADPDIQGLGVRLGLYFQLLSTVLLQLVRVEEALVNFLATALFFTSFFIAFIFSTARNDFAPGAVIACTWYPLLLFMAIFLFDFRHLNHDQQVARYGLGLILWVASGSLNVWFWFKGLDNVHPDQCMEPRVFFFANLNATGGVRVLFRILTLGFLGWFLVKHAPYFCRGFKQGFMQGWNKEDNEESDRKLPDEERGDGAMMQMSNESGENVSMTAQSPFAKSKQESDEARQISDSERQEGHAGTTIANQRISAPAEDSGTKESGSIVIESVSPSPPPEVATIEKSHDSIVADPDTSVITKVPSPIPISSGGGEDSGTKASESVEIESIPTVPTIPPLTTPVPEKTEAQTDVSSDVPPYVLSTDVVDPSREGSTQTSVGPDAYDWNITIASGIVFVMYLVPAELQLWWNHLDGIYSVNTTGQIIPLSLGSFSLLRALYLLKGANWSKLRRDPDKVFERITELRRKMNGVKA